MAVHLKRLGKGSGGQIVCTLTAIGKGGEDWECCSVCLLLQSSCILNPICCDYLSLQQRAVVNLEMMERESCNYKTERTHIDAAFYSRAAKSSIFARLVVT